jgi:hypothetical protein
LIELAADGRQQQGEGVHLVAGLKTSIQEFEIGFRKRSDPAFVGANTAACAQCTTQALVVLALLALGLDIAMIPSRFSTDRIPQHSSPIVDAGIF